MKICKVCGAMGFQVTMRVCTQEYFCKTCRLLPEYKMITRTTATTNYGFTATQLIEAYKAGLIKVFPIKNVKDKTGRTSVWLYYEYEIIKLRKDMDAFLEQRK
jgi:hypothetical protein